MAEVKLAAVGEPEPDLARFDKLPALYACDRCKRIGPLAMGIAHELVTGHVSELVSVALARGVREVWEREGRSLIDGDGPAARQNLRRGLL